MIRVLLAEDVHILRGALVTLLKLEPDIEVVADVGRGDEIVPTAQRCRPDVAVIDVDLPGQDGISAAAALHETVPGCRTVILTSLGGPATARRALAARVGGFLLKDSPPAELTAAIREVAAGGRVIGQDLALSVLESPECPLTGREQEILGLAAAGDGATDIATALHLSAGTVRNHLTAIVTKLDARNRIDAIRIATEQGWI